MSYLVLSPSFPMLYRLNTPEVQSANNDGYGTCSQRTIAHVSTEMLRRSCVRDNHFAKLTSTDSSATLPSPYFYAYLEKSEIKSTNTFSVIARMPFGYIPSKPHTRVQTTSLSYTSVARSTTKQSSFPSRSTHFASPIFSNHTTLSCWDLMQRNVRSSARFA